MVDQMSILPFRQQKFKAMLDPLVQVLSDMHQISKTDLVIIIIIIIHYKI